MVATALFALANAARAFLAVQQAARLLDLPAAAPAPYVALMSVAWAIAFGACAAGLARARRWAARVTIVAIVLYQANLWLNHLAFTRSSEASARAGFGALLSALSILCIGGAALWLDVRSAGRQAEAQPSPKSDT
ncbi:MAG: hypothetical protein D6709_01185 [Chloroflexi bacterium]|uniref:Uncharacterized protein n=1 Tax=Candidatus Thermofonsia Clade 3 bacterium TaxID=2364212 RepID=A0A2M8QC55_9CHLR|nr:MAG: hypothetical protein CUN48_09030 [Candidatus Thermofonsia Clade 3 bacterium]RMG65947.1 MAG: hypothetical protein D6709_01185 [Chloroflexota bacterium]